MIQVIHFRREYAPPDAYGPIKGRFLVPYPARYFHIERF